VLAAYLLQSSWIDVALSPWHCSCLLAGTQSPLWWQSLSPLCKQIDHAVRVFLVLAPSTWNLLPSLEIRLLPKSNTPLFYTSCSKLIFITVVGLGAPLGRFLEWRYINFPNERIKKMKDHRPCIMSPHEQVRFLAWRRDHEPMSKMRSRGCVHSEAPSTGWTPTS